MSEKYLFLCAYGCGQIKFEELEPFEDPEENPNLCCKCGCDAFFIVPNDIANDHEQREFEIDTDRTAEWVKL